MRFSKAYNGRNKMADVLAVRDEYRAQTWAVLIQKCNTNGLTKREFF